MNMRKLTKIDYKNEVLNNSVNSLMLAEEFELLEEKYNTRTDLLVFIIQTLDEEFPVEIQSKDNPIGLIRDKVDKVLNTR